MMYYSRFTTERKRTGNNKVVIILANSPGFKHFLYHTFLQTFLQLKARPELLIDYFTVLPLHTLSTIPSEGPILYWTQTWLFPNTSCRFESQNILTTFIDLTLCCHPPPSPPKRINTHLIRTGMGTDPKLTSIRMIVLIQIQFDTHLSNKPCLNRRSRKPLKAPCHKTNTRPNPHTQKEDGLCHAWKRATLGGWEWRANKRGGSKKTTNTRKLERGFGQGKHENHKRRPPPSFASLGRLLLAGWLAGLFLVRRVPPTGIRIGLFCERFYGC